MSRCCLSEQPEGPHCAAGNSHTETLRACSAILLAEMAACTPLPAMDE